MRLSVTTGASTNQKTACLILPVYAGGELPPATRAVDAAGDEFLSRHTAAGDIAGRIGDTLLVRAPGNLPCERVLLVGCGDRAKFNSAGFRKALAAAYEALRKTRCAEAVCFLTAEPVKGMDPYRRTRAAAEGWHDATYRFTAMKSADANDNGAPAQEAVAFAVRPKQAAAGRRGVQHGDAVGQGANLARDLGNMPANVCTPSYLAARARQLAKGDKRMRVEVLEEAELKSSAWARCYR